MQTDENNIINRLYRSFEELEVAISSAKKTLEEKESVPESVIERINSYDNILDKQRGLAKKLCHFINEGDWDEVARHVGLINGLSAMIRDDARAILSTLALNSDSADEDANDLHFC